MLLTSMVLDSGGIYLELRCRLLRQSALSHFCMESYLPSPISSLSLCLRAADLTTQHKCSRAGPILPAFKEAISLGARPFHYSCSPFLWPYRSSSCALRAVRR